MAPRTKRYWLFKVEPTVFSIDDLAAAPDQTTSWEGVRNYQVRNYLRDDIAVGDGVVFYHSNTEPPAAVGLAEVVRAGYPDRFQFEAGHKYFDPKADPDNPRWYMVDIRFVRKFAEPISITEMRETPGLEGMELLRRGSRLSITPVTPDEWRIITTRGKKK
jgi:predicted RNA-binding protein with PUA-like domain